MLILSPVIFGLFLYLTPIKIKEGAKSKEEEKIDEWEKRVQKGDLGDGEVETAMKELTQTLEREKKKRVLLIVSIVISLLGFLTILFILTSKWSIVNAFLLLIQIILSILILIFTKTKRYAFLIAVVLVYSLLLPVGYGVDNAYSKTRFIVIDSQQDNRIVLTQYDDLFIYVTIDPTNNTFKGEYNLLSIRETKKFYVESIGRIKRVDDKE